jgi:hypothetical protein
MWSLKIRPFTALGYHFYRDQNPAEIETPKIMVNKTFLRDSA